MKKLLFLGAFVFAAFFIINNFEAISENGGAATGGVTLPLKVAGLAVLEPDAKIVLPIRTLRVNRIADTWGAPRPGERRHEGQDLFAPRGTPIYSATAGYVWRIGENELGGKAVFIVGAGGRVYYYAHLNDFAPGLAIGDSVTTDTVLGFVGTTGNARNTPPHLHFGVYTADGAINPLPLLTDKF